MRFKENLNDNVIKSSRLVLCPTCDNELRADIEEDEVVCDCGKEIEIEEQGYPEEFIWHPNKEF